ncbi:MAG: methionine--tRNA ligase [Gammaproteobacteria bacterium]|nr:MAG: methionine--tRNA ligase [Gammaproteobacteria bacterium]
MTQQRDILVTSALPYANGPIHLGHLVEYIQTDIWVRFQKMRGHQITYCCADDAHGTPIMLRAEKDGITPQQLIDQVHQEHSCDFAGFLVDFDNFYSTHSPENETFSQSIYRKLRDNGYISEKTITQAYDPDKAMFLPDRFVKGTCPKCRAEDQYGDNCEQCGATYSPTDLIDPKSAISGKTPVEKDSKHYFFDLPKLEGFLKDWLESADIQPEIKNKMQEWFESGLQNWDISRDAPYWGFKIPDTAEGEDKYFYVWLDAPIGYMASFKNYCDSDKNTAGLRFDDYFNADSDKEMYHFIGKDIAYFHTLFWPATLEGSGYRKPTGVFCHGFLTVNGAKMSKSRGTFIKAETYLKHLRPEYLRYYLASKLSGSVEDMDLNLADFKQKNNSDIVGKLVNLASRNAGFIKKRFGNQLAEQLDNPALFDEAAQVIQNDIAASFEAREYAQAIRKIMQLADRANEYIDAEKPWILAKEEAQAEKLHAVCSTGINLFYQLVVALRPVLPQLAGDALAFLNVENVTWDSVATPLTGHSVNKFKPLAQRIEDKAIDAMVDESKSSLEQDEKSSGNAAKKDKKGTEKSAGKSADQQGDNAGDYISIDDFAKLDLRVAEVLECESVEGADKLLKFQLDVGDLGKRQVFSGIKKHYPEPAALVGRKVVLVANLAPRKMRFGLSEGMILSSENETGLFLMPADEQATAGDSVK